MTIQITEQWFYVGIIFLLIGIQIWQQGKIKKLYLEVTDLWEQLSMLTLTVSNKFTELDTKVKSVKETVESNDKK